MPFFFQPHIYFIFLRFWVFVGTVFPHCSHLSGLDFSNMQLFCLFTPNSLQKNKLRVCGSVEMRTHCFLNFCSRFWFIASLSDIVPGHPHVPCTVLSPFLTQLYVQLYMKQTMLCSIKIQTLLLQPPFWISSENSLHPLLCLQVDWFCTSCWAVPLLPQRCLVLQVSDDVWFCVYHVQ